MHAIKLLSSFHTYILAKLQNTHDTLVQYSAVQLNVFLSAAEWVRERIACVICKEWILKRIYTYTTRLVFDRLRDKDEFYFKLFYPSDLWGFLVSSIFGNVYF